MRHDLQQDWYTHQYDSLFAIARVAMATDFWRESAKIGIATFIVCAGFPQQMGEWQQG